MTRLDILERINAHRDAMDIKHGEWTLSRQQNLALQILVEEVGEVARALLNNDAKNLEDELFDVAQVAVAWLEGL